MFSEPKAEDSTARVGWFTTTHWSVVLTAGKPDMPGAMEALERLCRAYWFPLYSFVRRHGRSPEDAQDLTQEFFYQLLHKNQLQTATPERGRFRAFLITAIRNFLSNEWDKSQTIKRGSGQKTIPLDELTAENKYLLTSNQQRTPEELFDQAWALALLEQVRVQLQEEYSQSLKAERFVGLTSFLPGGGNTCSYAEAAIQMDMTEEAVRSEVYRMRKRYRELLRQEIAHTVATPEEIDDELRYLISVLK